MPRRTHTKSRHGCKDCKRRHIKCDETQPACNNCQHARITCTYIRFTPASNSTTTTTTTTTTTKATATSASPSATTLTPPSENVLSPHNDSSNASPDLQIDHLHLLSHFLLEAGPQSGMGVYLVDTEVYKLFMAKATSAPYLMYEVLAFAALHLSRSGSASQSKHYRSEAVRLQTQALAAFQDSVAAADSREGVSMLLFASLLSNHTLADIVRPDRVESDVDMDMDNLATPDFLDKFIDYMNVHRGVRAIAGTSWDDISTSELAPLIARATAELSTGENSPGGETAFLDPLWGLPDASGDLDESARTALKEAIRNLHLVAVAEKHYQARKATDAEGVKSSPSSSSSSSYSQRSMLFNWPALLTDEYSALLTQRNAQALVVLAHYAALLHPYSDVWIVGDAGRMLVRPIADRLGPSWVSWLDWPLAVVGSVT
ncbi:hypothetical protein EJ05DRAFT_499720 [Pseudovirgaria hyperparasitica]|uniref:Zn(2)-C6 fungal-type domain-containing protein n=1 Tax=Pseudovirgaria hyperparasitica TaxID=470096 RepID=A0A6A6WCK8_9PEZI|nr:uncharacterized protein EJ05DRAFT_499720 [Pseudovirgaria hyperparasitica]KAF2759307.1 hypothetical protein EJ05DRAFT_499720 [Pseudovirgaria hyperparasitica]